MTGRATINTIAATTRPGSDGRSRSGFSDTLFFGAFFLVPLLAGPLLFGAVRPAYAGPLAALLILGLLERLVASPLRRVWISSTKDRWLAAIFIAVFLSAVFSRIPALTALDGVRGFGCLAAFYASLQWCVDRRYARFFFKTLTLFGGALSVWGLTQLAGIADKDWWMRADLLSGPYVNHNHFCGLLELLLPVGLATAFYEKDIRQKIAFSFCVSLMGAALLFTLSRGGLIGITAGLLVWLILHRPKKIGWAPIAFIALAMFMATALVAVFGTETIRVRMADTRRVSEGTDLSMHYRVLTWRGAVAQIKKNPVVGTGPGTFGSLYGQVRPENGQFNPIYAHNDYLQAASEMGLPSLALMVSFFLMLVIAAGKAIPKDTSRFGRLSCLAALAGLASLAVHGLLDFNWSIYANAVLASALGGYLVAQTSSREVWPKKPVRITVALACLTVAGWAGVTGISDAHLVAAESLLKSGARIDAQNEALASVRFNPWNPEAHDRAATALALNASIAGQALPPAALSASKRASQLNPYEPYYDIHRAQMLLAYSKNAESVQASVDALNVAVSKDPRNGWIYFSAAHLLLSPADKDWKWRPDLERFLGGAMERNADWVNEGFQLLSDRAHYSLSDLQHFYEEHRSLGEGWLHYLEHRQLWGMHRPFFLEVHGLLPQEDVLGQAGSWNRVESSRGPFTKYFSETRDVDSKILPTYDLGGEVEIPSGVSRLCVSARGHSAARAYPYLYVKLDGKMIDSVYVDSESFKNFYVPLHASPGRHTLTIHYANDLFDRVDGRYRDLFIRDIVLEVPATLEGKEVHD